MLLGSSLPTTNGLKMYIHTTHVLQLRWRSEASIQERNVKAVFSRSYTICTGYLLKPFSNYEPIAACQLWPPKLSPSGTVTYLHEAFHEARW